MSLNRAAAVLFILSLLGGCSRSDRQKPIDTLDRLATVTVLEIAGYSQAPVVVLSKASTFSQLFFDLGAEHLYVQREPSGTAINFVFAVDGIFYALPAAGYRTLSDALHGEMLNLPDADVYYDLRRRGFPYTRYRSYFIE